MIAKGHVETALGDMEEQCRKEKEDNERWRRNDIEHESNVRKAQDSNEKYQAQVTSTEKQIVEVQMVLKQVQQKNSELVAVTVTDDEVKKRLLLQLEESKASCERSIKEYKRTNGLDKDHIVLLNQRISELETSVEGETNKCGRLTAKLDESLSVRSRIEHNMSDLETQCNQQQEQMAALSKQLNDLNITSKQREAVLENTVKSTQAELSTSIEMLRSEVLMGSNKITALLAAKAVAEQCISDLEASANGKTVENVNQKNQIQQLKTEKINEKQQTDSVQAGLQDELTALKAQLVALQTSSSSTIADLQTQLKQSHDSASLSASSALSKITADKQVEALTAQGKQHVAQLVALQASSSSTIAELQTQLKQSHDESASLSASSALSKITADKQVEALTAQGKQHVDEIATLKERIAMLETALLQSKDELTGTLKRHTEITIAKASAANADMSDLKKQLVDSCTTYEADISLLKKQLQDQKAATTSVTVEYQSFKGSSAAAVEVLELKGQTIAATADKELTELKAQLVALQTSSSSTIADLQTQLETTRAELISMSKQHLEWKTGIADAQAAADQLIETLKLANTNDRAELVRVEALLLALQEERVVMAATAAATLEEQKAADGLTIAELQSTIEALQSTAEDLQQSLERQTETAATELAALETRLYEECDAWEQEYTALYDRFEQEQTLLQAASLRITSMAESMQARSSGKRTSFSSTSIFDTSSHSTSFLVATVPPISPPPPPALPPMSVSDRGTTTTTTTSSSFSLPPSPVGRLMSSRNPTGSRHPSMTMQVSSEWDSSGSGAAVGSTSASVGHARTPSMVMDGITAAKAAVSGGVTTTESGTSKSPTPTPTLMGKLFAMGMSRDTSMASLSSNTNTNAGVETTIVAAAMHHPTFSSEKTLDSTVQGQRLAYTAQGPGLGEMMGSDASSKSASHAMVKSPPVEAYESPLLHSLQQQFVEFEATTAGKLMRLEQAASSLTVQTTMESLETTFLDKFSHLEAVLSGDRHLYTTPQLYSLYMGDMGDHPTYSPARTRVCRVVHTYLSHLSFLISHLSSRSLSHVRAYSLDHQQLPMC